MKRQTFYLCPTTIAHLERWDQLGIVTPDGFYADLQGITLEVLTSHGLCYPLYFIIITQEIIPRAENRYCDIITINTRDMEIRDMQHSTQCMV